jgi:hypothetical protein
LKSSLVFSITYLSLFREHTGDRLEEEHILDFMNMRKKLLTGLAATKTLESDPLIIW